VVHPGVRAMIEAFALKLGMAPVALGTAGEVMKKLKSGTVSTPL